jgi:tellurite resistance protein
MTAKSFPPASFFGMPLGVLGLGLAWRTAVHLWALPPMIAEVTLGLGLALWAVLILIYVAKWILAKTEALAEFEHAVQCCFIGLAPVTTSLAALAIRPLSPQVAIVLFGLGAAGTMAFALYRTGRLWMGERDIGATTPILYLPAVAGSFVTATAASLLGFRDWGQLAFGAGIFSWLAIESVLLHRLYTGPAMAPVLRPTLGIQLAPPAVGALAYLSVGSGAPDLFVQALIGYALLQALLLIRLAPWIRAQPFTPSYWAFSFGAAALASATIRLAAEGARVEQLLAPIVFAIANLLVLGLVIQTLRLALGGKLLPTPVALVSQPR